MPEIHLHCNLTDAQFNVLLCRVVGELRGPTIQAGRIESREMSVRLENCLKFAGLYSYDKILELISSGCHEETLLTKKNIGRKSITEFNMVFKDLIEEKANDDVRSEA